MTFKQFLLAESLGLLLEDPRVATWMTPQHIPVHVNGRTQSFLVTHIDMRFEDYNLDWMVQEYEAKHSQKAKQPGILSMPAPMVRPAHTKVPIGMTYSAPLADGRFINYNGKASNVHEMTIIDKKATAQVIREDWADFAEMLNDGQIVKPAKYDREERMALLDKVAG
jgi:hypothetical protein